MGLSLTPSLSLGSSDRAVVIGGGMGGLLAVRVLADFFPQVTLIERDSLPADPTFRSGVPQSRHIHTLLLRGLQILDQLFPGLRSDLLAHTAVPVNWGTDLLLLTPFGWASRYDSRVVTLGCTRTLLEWVVRSRLQQRPEVSILDRTAVLGLTGDASRVTGVQTTHGELSAALVIDASGRTSRTPQWLGELGLRVPRVETVIPFLGYASRLYHAVPGLDWKALGVLPRPPASGRGGVILSIEGQRWIVTLAGSARDYPPTDEVGFLAFAGSLPDSCLADALAGAEPASPISGFRRTENRRVHYERLRAWPARFVVLGDAVCALDPLYGQGMTVAAQATLLLRRELAAGRLDGLGQRFQRKLARQHVEPWLMAITEDLRYPTTEGRRAWFIPLLQRYIDRLVHVGTHDTLVHERFFEVVHFVRPSATLLAPDVLARLVN